MAMRLGEGRITEGIWLIRTVASHTPIAAKNATVGST
jgi:hypothetical protein